eukprot:15453881-Alexandrium_andersonii.AAC.1
MELPTAPKTSLTLRLFLSVLLAANKSMTSSTRLAGKPCKAMICLQSNIAPRRVKKKPLRMARALVKQGTASTMVPRRLGLACTSMKA